MDQTQPLPSILTPAFHADIPSMFHSLLCCDTNCPVCSVLPRASVPRYHIGPRFSAISLPPGIVHQGKQCNWAGGTVLPHGQVHTPVNAGDMLPANLGQEKVPNPNPPHQESVPCSGHLGNNPVDSIFSYPGSRTGRKEYLGTTSCDTCHCPDNGEGS